MGELSPFIAAGGVVSMFAISVTLLLRLLAISARQQVAQEERANRQADQLVRMGREHARCEHRLNITITALNKAGIEIPEEVWN